MTQSTSSGNDNSGAPRPASDAKPALPVFAGIPIVIDPYMPADEVWMIHAGKKTTVHLHEGPRAGESIEVWIKKPRITRIINIGDRKPKWPPTPPRLRPKS